jgi:hypothetical protein
MLDEDAPQDVDLARPTGAIVHAFWTGGTSEVAGEGVVGPSKSSQICISLNTVGLRFAASVAGSEEEPSKQSAAAAPAAGAAGAGISIMVAAELLGDERLAAAATEPGR